MAESDGVAPAPGAAFAAGGDDGSEPAGPELAYAPVSHAGERAPAPVPVPQAGPVDLPILPRPGHDYAIDFDPAGAEVTLEGRDLVFTFGDGGRTILKDFVGMAPEARLILPDGSLLSSGMVLAELRQLEATLEAAVSLETAAGPPSVSGGGTSDFADDFGPVAGLLSELSPDSDPRSGDAADEAAPVWNLGADARARLLLDGIADPATGLGAAAAGCVRAGETFSLAFEASFHDRRDGSETHSFLVRVPNAAWAGAGAGVTNLAAGNAFGVPAGDYLVLAADPLIDRATGIAAATVTLQAPHADGPGLVPAMLTVYAVSAEAAASSVASGEISVPIAVASGDTLLFGGDGGDELFGGTGDDLIVGQGGDDRLSGGAGADVFVMTPAGGHDAIGDFEATGAGATPHDVLDISALLTVDPAGWSADLFVDATASVGGAVVLVSPDGAVSPRPVATLSGIGVGDTLSVLLDHALGTVIVAVQ